MFVATAGDKFIFIENTQLAFVYTITVSAFVVDVQISKLEFTIFLKCLSAYRRSQFHTVAEIDAS